MKMPEITLLDWQKKYGTQKTNLFIKIFSTANICYSLIPQKLNYPCTYKSTRICRFRSEFVAQWYCSGSSTLTSWHTDF